MSGPFAEQMLNDRAAEDCDCESCDFCDRPCCGRGDE